MLSQNIKRRYNYLKCDIMNVYRNIHYYKKLRFGRVQQKNVLYLYVMSKSHTIYRFKANELYNRSCFALLAARIGDVRFVDVDLD